jgi:hypothetical protein
MLSPSPALFLHASADPFQPYLVVAPKSQPIDKIVLRRDAAGGATPRITAVTCETEAAGGNLDPLPASAPGAEEQAWIESHAVTPEQPNRAKIEAEIRRFHKL